MASKICRFAVATTTSLLLMMLSDAGGELVVEPFKQAVEPGNNITFTCSLSGHSINKTAVLTWTYSNSSHTNLSLQQLGMDNSVDVSNGTLTITNSKHWHAGTYSCADNQGSQTQTGVLAVYDMPDYKDEIIIVSSVCVVLLLATMGGQIATLHTQRKRLKISGTQSGRNSRKHGQVN